MRSDPRYRVLFSSLQIPGEVLDVLAVNPAFAKRHPDLLRALVRTWWASHDLIQAEPVASQALMAARDLRVRAITSSPSSSICLASGSMSKWCTRPPARTC